LAHPAVAGGVGGFVRRLRHRPPRTAVEGPRSLHSPHDGPVSYTAWRAVRKPAPAGLTPREASPDRDGRIAGSLGNGPWGADARSTAAPSEPPPRGARPRWPHACAGLGHRRLGRPDG